MNSFYLNGYLWRVKFLDPYSDELVDRTGELRVATTDPLTNTIFLSRALTGNFRARVFLHELGHAVMISYNMLDEIHRMVKPRYWVEVEEWVCNFIADYGSKIFKTANGIIGEDIWEVEPYE